MSFNEIEFITEKKNFATNLNIWKDDLVPVVHIRIYYPGVLFVFVFVFFWSVTSQSWPTRNMIWIATFHIAPVAR